MNACVYIFFFIKPLWTWAWTRAWAWAWAWNNQRCFVSVIIVCGTAKPPNHLIALLIIGDFQAILLLCARVLFIILCIPLMMHQWCMREGSTCSWNAKKAWNFLNVDFHIFHLKMILKFKQYILPFCPMIYHFAILKLGTKIKKHTTHFFFSMNFICIFFVCLLFFFFSF